MSEWQPIETAPKESGELFLLYQPHDSEIGFIFVGCRDYDGKWINNLDFEHQFPTHWMPLPPPPSE